MDTVTGSHQSHASIPLCRTSAFTRSLFPSIIFLWHRILHTPADQPGMVDIQVPRGCEDSTHSTHRFGKFGLGNDPDRELSSNHHGLGGRSLL
jgi:hypothetical protein